MRPSRWAVSEVSRALLGALVILLPATGEAGRVADAAESTFVHEAQVFGHADPVEEPSGHAGSSVSVSGDTAVIGAPDGAGAAHVFVRSGATWTLQQKLTAPGWAIRAALEPATSFTFDTGLEQRPR